MRGVPSRERTLRGLLVLGAAAATLALGCPSKKTAGDDDASGSATQPFEGARFSGCTAVTKDGVCEVAPGGTLRVWVPARPEEPRLSVDGAPADARSRIEVRGGVLLTVPAPTGQRLTVAVGARTFTLPLAPARAKPTSVREASELRTAGKLADARARLEADLPRARTAGDEVAVLGALARIALAEGRDDDVDRLFDQSIRAGEAAGRFSEAADDAFAQVFSLLGRVRLVEARRVLAHAATLSSRYPDGAARVRYYTASILAMSMQSREALAECRQAEDETARLGLVRLQRMAQQYEASILDDLGRVDDALAILDAQRRAFEPDMEPCDLADLLGTRGVVATHARDLGSADARAWLQRALDTYRTSCPASYDPARIANLEGYLARAELRGGRLDEAEKHLRASGDAAPHPRVEVALDRLLTRAEVLLARKRASGALASWDEMAAVARGIGNDDFLRLALDGRARALSALHRDADALAALEQAAAITERLLVRIPLGEGRESFAAEQERDDTRRVELLVALKRPGDAVREALRIRSRVLDALENTHRLGALPRAAADEWLEAVGAYRREREALEHEGAEDWKLSKESLAATAGKRAARADAARASLDAALARVLRDPTKRRQPAAAPRDATLALVPTEHGWWGLLTTGDKTRVELLGPIDPSASPERLGAAILGPFGPELASATRLAVVALGAARTIDVHALPWNGAPLLAKMPVVYPTDRGAPPPVDPAAVSVLVVGDPTSDLPFARREVDAVTAQLRAAGEAHVAVLTGAAATGAAVRAGLGSARLFHYAGHGKFAGRDGWQSALPLADHSELTVADILAMPRAPEAVVLLGCETARTSGEAQAEGLGLAQAFLVAGASAVVASTRTVDDAASAAIASALYEHLRSGGDVAEALRAAQIDAWKKGVADFGAFRALVR